MYTFQVLFYLFFMVTKQVSASGFDYSLCYGITGSQSGLYGTHTRYHDYSHKHLHVSVNKQFHVFISSTHLFIKQYEVQVEMLTFCSSNYVV